MQQKNFVVFILASIAILAGWTLLQNQLWPPRPPAQKQVAKKEADKKPEEKDAEKKADVEKKPEEKKQAEKPPAVEAVKPKPEAKPAPPVETYTLGNKDTHLQAVLTTRGAGVQKLTLNRFEAADYLGQPVKSKLDLIPEDTFVPSFLMYHYPDADAVDPVLGLGETTWQFEGRESLAGDIEQIKFSTLVPGLESVKITKTYRLGPKDYHLGLLLEFERVKDGSVKDGGDAKDLKFRYQLVGPHGLPVEGEWYTSTFRKAIMGMLDSRGNLIRDLNNEDAYVISHKRGGDRFPLGQRGDSMLQYAGVATQYFASMIVVDDLQPDKHVDRKKILAWARPTLESTELIGRFKGILGNRLLFDETAKKKSHVLETLPHVQRHLQEAGIKDNDQVILSYYTTPDGTEVATWIRRGQTPRPYLDDITVRVNSEPIDLQPGDKAAHQFLLYHGPVKTRLLGQFSGEAGVDAGLVDRYTERLHLRTLTDYRMAGPFGAFANSIGFTWLLIQVTKLMHGLLYLLSFLVFGSNGLSIILLTVLVRGLMFPISKKQALFSIRMQEINPELKKIQEKYKNDPQGRTQATMEVWRKHNVHPLASCWPMFLQLPIFLGLYYALQESISFRLAGFLWMDNLAAPDMLVWWSESIKWISDPDSQGGFIYLGPFFNLLPIVAVTVMFIQTKIMTPPPTDEQQAMQQKTMQFMMIFMGIIFYKVASGLCLYFIASSLWGLAERKLLPKKKPPGATVVAASPNGKAPPPGRSKGKGPAKPPPNDGTVQKVKDWWAKLLEDAKKK